MSIGDQLSKVHELDCIVLLLWVVFTRVGDLEHCLIVVVDDCWSA